MHDGMPYGRNQRQGQGHSREVDRQSPTGLIFGSGCTTLQHSGIFHDSVRPRLHFDGLPPKLQ